MKTVILSVAAGCASALVTSALHVSGLLSFESPATAALIAGLVVGGLTAFALSDYKRKPSFRVRPPAAPAPGGDPAAVETDWTYAAKPSQWGQPLSRDHAAADPAASAASGPAPSGPASEVKTVRQ
jgi:hypothetical protein